MSTISDSSLDQIFRQARTHSAWLDKPVTDVQLQALYDLSKWAPTSANTQPQRVLFLRSSEAKERLKPHLAPTNVSKSMAAPVVAIIAYDLEFYTEMGRMFPHNPTARSWFEGTPAAFPTAFRNGTLQGAYLMLAARALGLDCGPMSGFEHEGVDQEFFAGTQWKSNFLCNIGYGDKSKLFPRGPRLTFNEACKIL